jgi:hypothetical protein
LVWASQAGSVSGRIRKEPAGVRSGARLGQILRHLWPPAIIRTRIPSFPSLLVSGRSQFLPGLSSSDASVTQGVLASSGQIVVFEENASQADLGVPGDDPSERVVVLGDEEQVLERHAEPCSRFQDVSASHQAGFLGRLLCWCARLCPPCGESDGSLSNNPKKGWRLPASHRSQVSAGFASSSPDLEPHALSQVAGHRGLRQVQRLMQMADADLASRQQMQQPQAHRIGNRLEQLDRFIQGVSRLLIHPHSQIWSGR